MSKSGVKRDKFSPLTIVMLVLLTAYCVMLLFLLLWAVMQVFKPTLDFNRGDIVGFPKSGRWTLSNFEALFKYAEEYPWLNSAGGATRDKVSLWEVIFNSVVYAVGGALVNAIVTCIAAYLTARYNYFYSKIAYAIVIVVMIIPVIGAQASEIAVLKMFGLHNTRYGFLALKASFVGIYFLVFYETFRSIPMTYSEAAMMDGASDWRIMTRICFPLCKNVFMTVFMITFINYWNDYQMALLYMPDYPTLSFFLFQVQNASARIRISATETVITSEAPFRMAATVLLMVPVLLIFIVMHDKLMGNLSIGGIKG